jgi:hypothetical protein
MIVTSLTGAWRPPDAAMISCGGKGMGTDHGLRSPMRFKIIAEPRFLRATLYNRQTAEQTGEFLTAVATECIRLKCYRVLISVRSSKPIFTLEKYGFSSFVELALRYSGKFAVLTDSAEMRLAHEYAVMLARLRGVNARTFRDETAAVAWLESEL